MRWNHVRTGFTLIALCMSPTVTLAFQSTVAGTPPRADTIVKQAGRPVYPNGGSLVPELSIGVVEGPQEYMFGNVRDVLELRGGSILVVDAQSFAIRQYDAKGTYVRTLGRRGQGPGEYTRLGMVGELPDGRILVVDGGSVRVNVYSRDGESVDTWKFGFAGGNVASSRITVDTTGTAVATVYAFGGGIAEGGRLLRFAPDGRIVDTIPAPVFAYSPPNASASTGRSSASAVIPLFPVTRWAWSPLGYMVTGVSDRYAIELRIPARGGSSPTVVIPALRYRGPTRPWRPGDPVVSIRRTVPPVSVSDEQRSAERASVEAILRNIDPSWRYSGPDIPHVKPPYKDLRIGEDGTIWVHVSMPGERYMPDPPPAGAPVVGPVLPRWREPAAYDVFEPDGQYVGRVSRAANVTMLRMTRDRVWGTLRDDDGVEVVKRFRIIWR